MAKGLGRGMGALLGEESLGGGEAASKLPVAKIEPRKDQPRERFDEEKLAELAESIREHGVIQPITVRPLAEGYYQIIAGERRWRAARMAGLTDIPVYILDADEQQTAEMALIENLQREDLNPMEEARGYQSLMRSFGLTQEQVSARVGKSRPVITNSLRLLKLSESVQVMVEAGQISLSQARAILELEDEGQQIDAAMKAHEQDLSVKETTALVKRMKTVKKPREKKNYRLGEDGVDYVKVLEEELSAKLGRRVLIDQGAKTGTVKIEFYSPEDFEHLYKSLKNLKEVFE